MENVTVLGGLGYIGRHLIKLLVGRSYNVKILDCGYFGKQLGDVENCQLIVGDIRHAEDLVCAIEGADYVLNLSGIVGDKACDISENETWLHNIESSVMIADVCNYFKVKKFIFTSSCSVYGAAPSDVILNEGSYLNPLSHYARSKIESEKIFLQKINSICTILRLSTVFGYSPRMRFDLVANLFVIKALKERTLTVFGGTQFRPFIHCYDVARSFLSILDAPYNKIDKEIFNISSENKSIKGLAELISEIITGIKVEYITTNNLDDRNYRVSTDKIKWLIGYKPIYSLKSGIIEMIKEIEREGFEDWQSNKYVNHEMFSNT